MTKRYYWLKLNENFFEREEIKIIENMANGKDYIIFYLKLLLKSIKSEGRLLFRDVIPYTPDMLSAITGTDVDTVKIATDLFIKLELMEVWDDGTLFMKEIQNMIGSETDVARRVRKHRERKALEEPPKTEPKTNAERQRKYRAKQACKEVGYIPLIEDYIDNKRYNGNYYIVLKRDKFKCSICGGIENLTVYHIDGYDEMKPENNEENKLITLCEGCKSSIDRGKKIPKHILESIDYFYKSSNDNESCNTDVTECNKKKQTSNTDIDIDTELEKEIEIEKDKEKDTKLQQSCKDDETFKFAAGSIEIELARFMVDKLLEIKPNSRVPDKDVRSLQKWAQHIDYMIRLDKRKPEEIRSLFNWAQENSFWCANIRSPRKLREKWDTLELQRDREISKAKGNDNISKLEEMYRRAIAEEEE